MSMNATMGSVRGFTEGSWGAAEAGMARRLAYFAYGLASYAVFFLTFLYAAGFMGNFLVPKAIDSPRDGSLWAAALVNLGLLSLFAVQHSAMARPAFKRWWTRLIPAALERSTYVLFSSAAMILLFLFWRPMGIVIWDVQNTALRSVLWGAFAFGWLLVLVTTLQINHFDLFGLRQVWLYLRGREYTPVGFRTPVLYRFVRHPLYVGWIIAFWATPTMTAAHLFFAVVATAYMLVAIQFEERDLIAEHGRSYIDYRKKVRALLPIPKRAV